MFKCTDCGQEFKIKPDYCDCGNNVFEEIVEKEPSRPTPSSAPAPEPVPALEPVPAPETPKATKVQSSVDLPSLLIFFTCIILSIFAWIFIGRDVKTVETTQTMAAEEQKVTIPSIDKLWKENKIVKAAEPVVTTPVTAAPVVQTSAPLQMTTSAVKTKAQTTKKSEPAAKISTVKTAPVQQTQSKAPTTVQNQPSMTEAQKEEIIKKLTKTQKTPTSTTTPAQTQQTQTVQTAQTTQTAAPVQQKTEQVKQAEAPKVDYEAQKKELAAYKIALRNKIGGNINFAAVIGDGKCAVTFKLDSTGNLIDRKFSLQSTNDSLNGVVYSAMMQNPTYKAPPAGYKDETLTLSVQIYGGQFEVDLK